MAITYPTSVTSYTAPTGTDNAAALVGGRTLADFLADHGLDIAALETKLGIGASTPVANTLLRGTGAGSSAFGALQTGDIAANAITNSDIVTQASIVNITTTSYADIMTLSYTSAGGDLIVLAMTTLAISSGTPGNHWITIRLDSGTDVDLAQTDGVGTKQLVATRKFVAPSAGVHTLALRGVNSAAGTYQSFYRTLRVLELKK